MKRTGLRASESVLQSADLVVAELAAFVDDVPTRHSSFPRLRPLPPTNSRCQIAAPFWVPAVPLLAASFAVEKLPKFMCKIYKNCAFRTRWRSDITVLRQ